jgi:hypothetical protein
MLKCPTINKGSEDMITDSKYVENSSKNTLVTTGCAAK